MGCNKFEWIDAVASDPRLKVGERFVLTNTAIRYVLYGEDVFRVRQTTIADHFAISVRTVRDAMSRGREHGYLVLAEGRMRGRSHHGPDVHRLVIPADSAGNDGLIPAEIDRNTGTNRHKYRQNSTEIPAAPNTPTSGNDDPKVLSKDVGKGEGEGRGSAAPLTPSPSSREDKRSSPYCARHPDGTDDPCHACGQARRRHEATQAEVQRDAAEARRAEDIPHCDRCDRHGFIQDRALDREASTPLVFVEAERRSEVDEEFCNWLVECTDPGTGLSWLQAPCPHGSGEEGDDRASVTDRLSMIFAQGYQTCGLDLFLAAQGDFSADEELATRAQEEWVRLRDEVSAACNRVPSAQEAAGGQEHPRNHDDVPHPESWPEFLANTNEDRNAEDIVPVDKPSRFCAQHPGGTGDPCHACGWARTKNEQWIAERAEWTQWNDDMRAAIRRCRRCDARGQCTTDDGSCWWCEHYQPDSQTDEHDH